MKAREWGAFALLGLLWGSSFLWIKVALADIGPFMLAAMRVLFGVLGLLVVMRLQRRAFPRDPRVLGAFAVVGLINTAIPFVLIPWGEQYIDSGVASILNGTAPLFTIVIAHFALQDEKITLPRLAGLSIGFVGVVVLFSRDLDATGFTGNVAGQLAVLGASACYAVGITYSRRHLRGQPPVVQATSTLLVAEALLWVSVPVAEQGFHFPTLPLTWVALLWLGLLGSCLAYLLYFYLINALGPTRASMVTYVFPVIGLILGIAFLNEQLDWHLAVGSLLIVASIGVVNYKHGGAAGAAAVAAPPVVARE